MLEDVGEEGIITFLLFSVQFSDAAKVNNDWFDTEFMSFVNTVIKKLGKEERLMVFGDANGIFITYKTPESVLGAVIVNSCGIVFDNWVFVIGQSSGNYGILNFSK